MISISPETLSAVVSAANEVRVLVPYLPPGVKLTEAVARLQREINSPVGPPPPPKPEPCAECEARRKANAANSKAHRSRKSGRVDPVT
jgi:hypothetical protein